MVCFVEGLTLITKAIVHKTPVRWFGYNEGTIGDKRDTRQARNEEQHKPFQGTRPSKG